jgi:uncharacterized membrane protein
MRKRIGLVIRLFGEAQKCISKMHFILFLPFVTFVVLMMFIFYWLTTAMMIYSFGKTDLLKIYYLKNFHVCFDK